jgi:hypothetical protein
MASYLFLSRSAWHRINGGHRIFSISGSIRNCHAKNSRGKTVRSIYSDQRSTVTLTLHSSDPAHTALFDVNFHEVSWWCSFLLWTIIFVVQMRFVFWKVRAKYYIFKKGQSAGNSAFSWRNAFVSTLLPSGSVAKFKQIKTARLNKLTRKERQLLVITFFERQQESPAA